MRRKQGSAEREAAAGSIKLRFRVRVRQLE
jgi:hypothetical protein